MKKFLFIIMSLFLLASTHRLVSKNLKANFYSAAFNQTEEKVKIKKEELPEAARKTLEGDAFKGWSTGDIYKMKSGGYVVELKKGKDTQSIKFDKDGKVK